MTEPPDFDHIARLVIQRVVAEMPHYATTALNDAIVDHLRQVWNARGAADTQAVESRIRELVADEVIGAGVARHVSEAIRKVDR